MEVKFTSRALHDLDHWQKSGNKGLQNKITQILSSIRETPFAGIGKPEALKHELSGKWSRRLDREHRIVYSVSDSTIYIYSLKGHY